MIDRLYMLLGKRCKMVIVLIGCHTSSIIKLLSSRHLLQVLLACHRRISELVWLMAFIDYRYFNDRPSDNSTLSSRFKYDFWLLFLDYKLGRLKFWLVNLLDILFD